MIMTQRFLRSVLLALAVFPLQSCTKEYSAKAIEAWVVDADTGQPLEGVNVVAHWELNYGLEGGGAYQLTVMETVADSAGRFTFPAWGPKQIPKGLPSEARMKSNDLGILIFKAGYDTTYRANKEERRIPTDFGDRGAAVREWYANGDKVKLMKIKNMSAQLRAYRHLDKESDIEIEAWMLLFFDTKLHVLLTHSDCGWRDFPRAIASAEMARRNLLQDHEDVVRKVFFGHRTQYEKLVSNDANLIRQCGQSPKKLFEIAQ